MKRTAGLATVVALALVLSACAKFQAQRVDPTKKGATRGTVRDSVYIALDRDDTTPPGYGLYTVVLTRRASPQAARVLTEIFIVTPSAAQGALQPERLNLIVFPVKDSVAASAALAPAREAPDPTAGALLSRHYDYGQAQLLLGEVCRAERGAAVMRACSSSPDGPIIVTGTRPFDPGSPLLTQRLLVVNLGATKPAALAETMEAYRRQIQRNDVADGKEFGLRLEFLNRTLEIAGILPFISKAYALPP